MPGLRFFYGIGIGFTVFIIYIIISKIMIPKIKEVIRSHMNEYPNDERLVKKFVIDRKVVKDFYDTPLYIKGHCPKCGCELKSCEADYCRVCGQALNWDNPEGGL